MQGAAHTFIHFPRHLAKGGHDLCLSYEGTLENVALSQERAPRRGGIHHRRGPMLGV